MFRLSPILIAAFLLSPQMARCETPPLLVSIGVPANMEGKRWIVSHLEASFPVVVTNTSDKPLRIWWSGTSYGNDSITFGVKDEHGTTTTARSAIHTWTGNGPFYYELAPQESGITDVRFADPYSWKGFPIPAPNETKKVTMFVVLRILPDDEGKKLGIWTGEVRSKPMEYLIVGADDPKAKPRPTPAPK